MDSQTEQLYTQYLPLLEAVMLKAQAQLDKDGFTEALLKPLEEFKFHSEEDSFSRELVLKGRWAENSSQRRGMLLINTDGSVMFELDLLCQHPKRPGRWAEQVSVWGRDPDSLRSEVSLLAEFG